MFHVPSNGLYGYSQGGKITIRSKEVYDVLNGFVKSKSGDRVGQRRSSARNGFSKNRNAALPRKLRFRLGPFFIRAKGSRGKIDSFVIGVKRGNVFIEAYGCFRFWNIQNINVIILFLLIHNMGHGLAPVADPEDQTF